MFTRPRAWLSPPVRRLASPARNGARRPNPGLWPGRSVGKSAREMTRGYDQTLFTGLVGWRRTA